MSLSPLEYLRHMLDEACFLIEVRQDLSLETLARDEVRKRAVVRSIEVIGEAAKKVPNVFREQYLRSIGAP